MRMVELISTGDGEIMETLDYIGIKLFVLYSASVMHYRLCLVTVCMRVLHNGRFLRFSKSWLIVDRDRDSWCTFSWSICNQNGRFIRCVQSSSFQGYDFIYKSWEDIIS